LACVHCRHSTLPITINGKTRISLLDLGPPEISAQ
jgi:hypothetical protein